MLEFFGKYFIEPIYQGTGYNLVNTLTYSIFLIIGVIFTYKLIKKFDIKIDKNFFVGIIPFIFFGGLLRSFEDYLQTGKNEIFLGTIFEMFLIATENGLRNILLVTPIMYFTIFLITMTALLVSIFLGKKYKISYHKIWFSIGSLLSLMIFFQLKLVNFDAMFLMIGLTLIWAVLLLAVKKYTKHKFFSDENYFITLSHMFDASTTFVSLQFYNYVEQHVLPGFLISIFGPSVMFFLKFIVVSFVLYKIDEDDENEELKKFIKITILILGLAPGLRNFFRLVMGV